MQTTKQSLDYEINQEVVVEKYSSAKNSTNKRKKLEVREGVIKCITPSFINVMVKALNGNSAAWEESYLKKDLALELVVLTPKLQLLSDIELKELIKEVC